MSDIKIIVFGATGNTGSTIIERGVKEGFIISAFVRSPSKLSSNLQNDVKIIKGDVLKREEVEDAIEGHDFVLSALGTGWSTGPTTLISEGMSNIVSGMKKHGVKKLAFVGVDSLIPGKWNPYILRHLIEDHRRQVELLVKEKDCIDWVALMPPSLWKSSYVSPSYQVQKGVQDGCLFVTTGELADFMFKCVRDDNTCQEYKHILVGISSRPAIVTPVRLAVGLIIVGAATAYFMGYLSGLE